MNKYIYMKQGTLQLPLSRFPLDLDLLNDGPWQKTCKKIVAEQVSKAWHPKHIFRDAYTYHKNLRILPLSSWLQMIFVPKWAVSDCVVFFFRLNWGPNANQACCCTSISTFIEAERRFWTFLETLRRPPKKSPLDRDQNKISNVQDVFKWRSKNCKVS